MTHIWGHPTSHEFCWRPYDHKLLLSLGVQRKWHVVCRYLGNRSETLSALLDHMYVMILNVYVYIYICMHVYIYMYMCQYIYICQNVYICTYIYMNTSIGACIHE